MMNAYEFNNLDEMNWHCLKNTNCAVSIKENKLIIENFLAPSQIKKIPGKMTSPIKYNNA